MSDQAIWLEEMRRAVAGRRSAVGTAGSLLERPPRTTGAALVEKIRGRWEGDLAVSLDVPALLADRLSISQALLNALLKGGQGPSFVQALRRRVPSHRDTRNWLMNDVGMSLDGANCVIAALSGGDFDAIVTLTSESFRLAKDEDDAVHMRAPVPLNEAQAQLLVNLIFDAADIEKEAVRWVVLEGIEELVGGGSPHVVNFRTGLRRWLMAFLQKPRTVLVGLGWSGAVGRLDAIEHGLRRHLTFGEGAGEEDAALLGEFEEAFFAAGLSRLSAVPLERELEPPAWRGQSSRTALIHPVLTGVDDPARWAVIHVGALVERMPLRCAAVVPVWALGTAHANSRQALTRAYLNLSWVPLSLAETCAVIALGRSFDRALHEEPDSPHYAALQALQQRMRAAWA